jgi:hypothetical protein
VALDNAAVKADLDRLIGAAPSGGTAVPTPAGAPAAAGGSALDFSAKP